MLRGRKSVRTWSRVRFEGMCGRRSWGRRGCGILGGRVRGARISYILHIHQLLPERFVREADDIPRPHVSSIHQRRKAHLDSGDFFGENHCARAKTDCEEAGLELSHSLGKGDHVDGELWE